MSTKILHGQMSVVDANGNVQVLHQETSSADVLVDRTTNTQGTNGASAIPSNVKNIQKLSDNLGKLAFKSSVANEDLEGNFVVVDETTEADAPPESEINDSITSETLTWSSKKLNTHFNEIINRVETVNNEANSVFYIALVENADGSFTARQGVAEIEAAYRANKTIWVISSDVFLPLKKRQDANTWIFSGYTETQGFDITITSSGVTFTYYELATKSDTLPNPNVLRLTGAVNAVYDGTTEVAVEIPTTDTADTAKTLATARKISLTGGATGTATEFDGSKDISIPVTALDPDKLSSVVPISKGGTGANTAAGAITKLGITAKAIGAASSSHSHTAADVGAAAASHTHTFNGTSVTSGKPDTTNRTSITPVTDVGKLPSISFTQGSLQTLTSSCSNRRLTLTFNQGTLPTHTFDAGSLPTLGTAISVPNINHTHDVTPSGGISSAK